MDLILLSKGRGQLAQWHLGKPGVWVAGALVALPIVAAVFFTGFKAATYFGVTHPDTQVRAWRADLAEQAARIDERCRGARRPRWPL